MTTSLSHLPTSPPAEPATRARASGARTLSGITPSGPLTLGNYLGALRRFVEGQADRHGLFFVADLHAMTTAHDPPRLRSLTRQTAALFYAAGLDPDFSTVFLQSQVHAHVELAYLLECTAYVGELSRMIQFKEKGGRPATRASLFSYPCLMAADILLYDTAVVPVGGDQDQHVELARDLAERFNATYQSTFVVPRLDRAALAARVADLAAPEVKMSKSAPDAAAGVLRLLDPPDLVRRKVMRAVTDSDSQVRYDPVAKPGVSNLLDIVAALTGTTPAAAGEGYSSYGALKRACVDAVVAELEPLQRRYTELVADPELLDALLERGAAEARELAAPVLRRARSAMGLPAA